MNGSPPAGSGRKQMRQQRLAELIADDLRARILSGELHDGDLLPKEAELREEFGVSKPSFREALRILEAEGLLSVQRGKVGGSVVHVPTPAHAAYTLSLVLRAQDVDLGDVGAALREVEPLCAALCAERTDRARKVVPVLRKLHDRNVRSANDLVAATALSRQFHETLVALCGNRTLIVVVGALEALWSGYETDWAARAESGAVPVEERLEVLEEHARLVDLIAAGDAAAAREAATEHLHRVQAYPTSGDQPRTIDVTSTRRRLLG